MRNPLSRLAEQQALNIRTMTQGGNLLMPENMTDRTRLIRDLATQIAPLLPGTWHAEWDEHTVGAYLVTNGEYVAFPVSIYVSAQGPSSSSEKRGMIRLSPRVPEEYRTVGVDDENKVTDIYVSENKPATLIAGDITRRILGQQDFLARHARQAKRIIGYHIAEQADEAMAAELAEILGTEARGSEIRAWPHGNWRVSNALTGGSIHFTGYLPAKLAFKVARLIMDGYEEHRRSYP